MNWGDLSQTVLGLVKSAAGNKSVQQAGISLLQGIGQHIQNNAGDTARMERLGKTLQFAAPVILGAIVKDTPAESTIPKSVISQVDEIVRSDNPGG